MGRKRRGGKIYFGAGSHRNGEYTRKSWWRDKKAEKKTKKTETKTKEDEEEHYQAVA